MSMQRVANVERTQMLVESPSRAALQCFLSAWQAVLHSTRRQPEGKGLIRWAVDVDPPRHRLLKTQFCYLWTSSQSIRKKRGRLDLST